MRVLRVKLSALSSSFLLSLVLSLLSSSADAQHAMSRDERDVRAAVAAWTRALVERDSVTAYRVLSPEYRVTTSDAQVLTREQDLAPVLDGSAKFISAETSDVVVRIYGKTAIVTGKGTFTGTYQSRPFTVVERFTDVYVKDHRQWRAVAGHSTSVPAPRK